jgi:AraC-like DNA-binding protein
MVPLIRSACLTHYAAVARSVGLDPELMLKKAKLPLTAIERPDMRIAVTAVRRLFEMSATESGCATFGLKVAGRGDLSDLGPVALVIREQPTIGAALQVLSRFLHIHHEGMVLIIERHEDTVILRTVLRGRAQRQATEAVVATLYLVTRALSGPSWRPLEVHLMHSASPDRSAHGQFFGCDVRFDADFDGIVCKASDMDRVIPWADPKLARYVQDRVDELYGRPESFDAKVGALVHELLSSGDCRIERVAEHLACDRRTVHRRLAECGTTFSEIVDTERAELAARLVEDRTTPLAGMAELLGFSAQSAMARWFRHRFGCSITQWRRDHRPAASLTSPQRGEVGLRAAQSG